MRRHIMAERLIKNALVGDKILDILCRDGKIVEIGKIESGSNTYDAAGKHVYPGLIDIHAHGCIGHDTMEGGLVEMAQDLKKHGTTTWYPTTMTMPWDEIEAATAILPDTNGGAHIPGFHAEGPYINEKYKGAQSANYILKPDAERFAQLKNISIVTIAPEAEGAEEFIKNCSAVVSLGHTACTYDDAIRAIDAGAKCITHTFNAMPGLHHREPSLIGAGFERQIYAQVICDGRHIHRAAILALYRLFGVDRMILISDSMRATGLGDGKYDFGGQVVTVDKGAARTPDGALAGSTSYLFDCVKTAISFGIPADEAFAMATRTPAELMGISAGKIEVGYSADFVVVDDNYDLIDTIIA
jgi:N-acetylglucosamine-6-phosphate deacetylase